MVDIVEQLREVKSKDFHPDSLKTMVLWGADEIERLRAVLEEIVNPLAAIGRRARENGLQFSGMAYSIAHSVEHLQGIAKAALKRDGAT